MAKKKKGGANNNNGGGGGGGGEKKEVGMNVVVMKIDLHCEGCAAKVIKAVRSFDGVESAKVGDGDLTKLTVVGRVEPAKLREKVELKTKKKAEIISPSAKKDKNDDAIKDNNGSGDAEEKEKKKQPQPQPQQHHNHEKNESKNKKDESKPKELPMTTAVLKVNLHCQGCIEKIHKAVSKTKGYMEMSIDKQKDLMTVKGAIDVKALVEKLKGKLKRSVEIVPPKKEGGGGGGDNNKGGGSGEKVKGGGGEEKAAGKGNGGGGGGKGGGVEGQKMEYGGGGQMGQVEYIDYGSGYGAGYTVNQVIAPELFSDENPNACVVM